MLINISTDYRDYKRDFDSLEDFEIYLIENNIEESEDGNKVIDFAKEAIKTEQPYTIIAVDGRRDIIIDFDYEDQVNEHNT